MQYYARIDYNYGGSIYTIPFSYIHKTDIKVYVNNTEYTDFEFLNDSQIQLNNLEGLTSEDIVTIKRETNVTEKIVTYQNMSMVLDEDNLNMSQDQILNSVQEIHDYTQLNIDNMLFDIKQSNTSLQALKKTLSDEIAIFKTAMYNEIKALKESIQSTPTEPPLTEEPTHWYAYHMNIQGDWHPSDCYYIKEDYTTNYPTATVNVNIYKYIDGEMVLCHYDVHYMQSNGLLVVGSSGTFGAMSYDSKLNIITYTTN